VRSHTILVALGLSAWAVAGVPAAGGLVAQGAATLLFITERGPNPESLELQLHGINTDGTGAQTLLRGLPDGHWVEFSPDKRSFAFITEDQKQLLVVRVDGSARKVVAKRIDSFAWAPSGKRLTYATDEAKSRIYTVGVDGSGRRRLIRNSRRRTYTVRPYLTLAWSADGRRIAFTSQRADSRGTPLAGSLHIIRSDGTRQMRVPGLRGFIPEEIAWSPARQELAVGGVVDAGVRLVRPDRRSVVAVRGTDCCIGVGVAWSPDSTRLAFLGGDTSEGYAGGVTELHTSRTTIFKQFDGPVFAPAWSGDGAKLAFIGCDKYDVCDLYVADRNGHQITRVPNSPLSTFDGPVAWAP
jgi:dipeptidyl aminopeptidase/acylaminoacyl peptidase